VLTFPVQEGASTEPVDQLITVGGREDVVQRVIAAALAEAGGDPEEMQVVIPEDDRGSVAEAAHVAENVERAGAAVDEVADEPESVARRCEPDLAQQPLEGVETPLDVADGVGGRDFSAASYAQPRCLA